MAGNPRCIFNSSFGVINKFTESFSNMESKSIATCLTDLEGDDTRLMTGKTNKSSSFTPHAVPAPTNSAKRSTH